MLPVSESVTVKLATTVPRGRFSSRIRFRRAGVNWGWLSLTSSRITSTVALEERDGWPESFTLTSRV